MSLDRLRAFFLERVKTELSVEGIMPERALLRLKRAGISVYNAKKVQKNQILLSVKGKDIEKVFAIFPKVCYNIEGKAPYSVKKIGTKGVGKYLCKAKKRVGLLLGGLLFCAATLFADQFVFGVRFVGSEVYAREALAALAENGIKPFSPYEEKGADGAVTKLLSVSDMEFCSVKKQGLWAVVEMRLSSYEAPRLSNGDMTAKHSGVLTALTVLRGTAVKRTGESVAAGEILVGGYLQTPEGEKRAAAPIARASIACVYEAEIAAEDEESAFAQAYLSLGLSEADTLTKTETERTENSFRVRMEYTVVETVNLNEAK